MRRAFIAISAFCYFDCVPGSSNRWCRCCCCWFCTILILLQTVHVLFMFFLRRRQLLTAFAVVRLHIINIIHLLSCFTNFYRRHWYNRTFKHKHARTHPHSHSTHADHCRRCVDTFYHIYQKLCWSQFRLHGLLWILNTHISSGFH